MIVGTAGHIDHGKTSLIRALTGIDTDRLPEEKARGITLDLGFAYVPVAGGGVLGFVDVPGHERLVHTMIAGATIHTHPLKNPEVIERLGIAVRTHPEGLADADYHRLLGGMTVNLCVSQSEVYSYLTAESFLMETPVLTGSITPLIGRDAGGADWLDLCHTAHFEDPVAIRDHLLRLIEAGDELGPRLREHMLTVNGAYRAQCKGVLERWGREQGAGPDARSGAN